MDIINDYSENSSWIELSRKSFFHNVSIYRNIIEPNVLLGSVLKGNAYGHGFNECLEILHEIVDVLFVISPIDAFKIRNYEKKHALPLKRIIVLGTISPAEALDCARRSIEVVVGDTQWIHENYIETLRNYERHHLNSYKPLKIHFHIDTGLGREGFCINKLAETVDFFEEHKDILYVQGVLSHFSNVEDVTEQSYALEQVQKFDKACEIISKTLGLKYTLERHIGQSASSIIMPEHRYDLIRVGISLYGFWSSKETKLSARVILHDLPKFQPVLQWKTKSQTVKEVPLGSYISYGCTFRADRNLRIAVLPVGYFDGYPRLLSGKAYVLVNGKRCKVLGRVMMNHIVIDVTEATTNCDPIEAVLIGESKNEIISMEMLAEWAQTIHYEIAARLGSHLKRVITE